MVPVPPATVPGMDCRSPRHAKSRIDQPNGKADFSNRSAANTGLQSNEIDQRACSFG